MISGYGPVLLTEAYQASIAARRTGLAIGVINLPSLNRVDAAWLLQAVRGQRHVIALDHHHRTGGQGDRIAEALPTQPWSP